MSARSTCPPSCSERDTTYPSCSRLWGVKGHSILKAKVAAAKAAASKKALQILSTQSSIGVEDVIAARGAPIWYQLYTTNSWDVTQKARQTRRKGRLSGGRCDARPAERTEHRNAVPLSKAGHPRLRELPHRRRRRERRPDARQRQPMFTGINMDGIAVTSPSLTWDFIKRLKDVTTMKVVLKGVQTREDAALAVKNGADGIIVSNHGGRSAETLRGTIDCLPEVIQGAGGRIPVIVDSGSAAAPTIFKALAMGARAVAIGRPYIGGLSSFGQTGVEKVLEILTRELTLVMGSAAHAPSRKSRRIQL